MEITSKRFSFSFFVGTAQMSASVRWEESKVWDLYVSGQDIRLSEGSDHSICSGHSTMAALCVVLMDLVFPDEQMGAFKKSPQTTSCTWTTGC